MKVHEFLNNPEWYKNINEFLEWATSAEIEISGEGRRQLGYEDGYAGQPAASQNSDYMRGWRQGLKMKFTNEQDP